MQDRQMNRRRDRSEEKSWQPCVQKPIRVKARQITGGSEKVKIGSKRLTVKEGDWVVEFPSGIKKRYRDEQFRELFSYAGPDENEDSSDWGPPGVAL